MHYLLPFVAMLGLGAAAPLLMAPPEVRGPLPASYISSPQRTTRNLDHPLLHPERSNGRAQPITGSDDDAPSLPKRSKSTIDSGDATKGRGPLPKRTESTTEVGDVTDAPPLPRRSESTTESGDTVDEPGKLP